MKKFVLCIAGLITCNYSFAKVGDEGFGTPFLQKNHVSISIAAGWDAPPGWAGEAKGFELATYVPTDKYWVIKKDGSIELAKTTKSDGRYWLQGKDGGVPDLPLVFIGNSVSNIIKFIPKSQDWRAAERWRKAFEKSKNCTSVSNAKPQNSFSEEVFSLNGYVAINTWLIPTSTKSEVECIFQYNVDWITAAGECTRIFSLKKSTHHKSGDLSQCVTQNESDVLPAATTFLGVIEANDQSKERVFVFTGTDLSRKNAPNFFRFLVTDEKFRLIKNADIDAPELKASDLPEASEGD